MDWKLRILFFFINFALYIKIYRTDDNYIINQNKKLK